MPEFRLAARDARRFAFDVLSEAGFSIDDADACSDLMVESSLRGIDSHGLVALLPTYVAQAHQGVGHIGCAPTIESASGGVTIISGGGSSGPRTARLAASEAASRARRYGAAVTVASGVGYLGALWWTVHPVALDGLIALATCNAMAFVAPHGGKEALHGTNPIAGAVPATPAPIVIDIRTNAFSMADFWSAVVSGDPMPEGLLMRPDGTPITDPVQLERDGWDTAVSFPLAGARGYALALLVDVLTAGLSGGAIGREVTEDAEKDGLSLFVLVLDPAAFGSAERFSHAIQRLATQAQETQPVDPAQPVRLPGQRAAIEYRQRLEGGIPIQPMLWDGLAARLAALGIATPPAQLQEVPT